MQIPVEKDPEMQKPYFFKWVDGEIAKRDEEEWKRLFYVAVTRAKSRLFLSGVHKKKKEEKKTFREMACWMDWAMAICGDMEAVKISKDSGTEGGSRISKTEDLNSKVEALIKDVKWKEGAPSGSEAFMPGTALPRSIDLPVSAYVLFFFFSGEFWRRYQVGWTVLDQDSYGGSTSMGTAGKNEWAGEDVIFSEDDFSVADFGTAMHGFFEHWDLGRSDCSPEPEALERIFGHFGKEAVNDARKIIRDFMKQPVFQELRKARQVKREIDFVLNERRGLIHGKIDILFEDAKGEWHILDYKTAAGDEEAAHKSAYDLQLEIYALAAERILKLPVRSAIIYYLKNQKAVTLSFPKEKSAAFFEGLETKIRGLQQRILDYSNERMAKEFE